MKLLIIWAVIRHSHNVRKRFAWRHPALLSPVVHQGLTLVELLVSLVIITIAIGGVGTIINLGVSGTRKSEYNYDLQNSIDRNLSQIESYSDRYVYTSSGGSILSGTPTKSSYVLVNDSDNWTDFSSRCQQTTVGNDIVSPLVALINAQISVPSGLYRELSVHGAGSADEGLGRVKHFTVVYRLGDANGLVVRNSTIIPTVVSYCP